jgi:ferric citrate transport system permease protein
MITSFWTKILTIVLLTHLAILIAFVSLFAFSAIPITPHDVIATLYARDNHNMAQAVVLDLRLPRTLVALMVGGSLATAGLMMQSLTRNPLASPSLFGINSGAALGVAIVSTLFLNQSDVTQSIAAVLGGSISWLLVMVLGGAWRGATNNRQIILAGIAIAALCGALTKATIILVEEQAASVMTWLAGSFANANWAIFYRDIGPLLVGAIVTILLSTKLNVLLLGDERAQSLGININRLRILISLLVLIMVGVCVSSVGAIAFIGLLVPHMAKALFGYDHRWLVISTFLLGAILTICADVLSRVIMFPTETPAGALLALIGAPFFLYLVRKN